MFETQHTDKPELYSAYEQYDEDEKWMLEHLQYKMMEIGSQKDIEAIAYRLQELEGGDNE